MAQPKEKPGIKLIAQNRRARHEYEIEETLEAGIVLQGTEVKSCRDGKVNLQDAFAKIDGEAVWLHQCHIAPYSHGNRANHDPVRPRKLLLHAQEIERLRSKVEQEGRALVPLKLYLKSGLIKAEIAVGRGKKLHDRRRDIAQRSDERRMRQELGRRR